MFVHLYGRPEAGLRESQIIAESLQSQAWVDSIVPSIAWRRNCFPLLARINEKENNIGQDLKRVRI